MNDFFEDFEPLNIPILGVKLPKIEIADSYLKKLKLKDGATNSEFLRALCIEGFKKLNLPKTSKDYKVYGDRIKYELSIVEELGFTDYFLLVWKVVNFCKENKIPIGLGRGSAVGSLVLYLIGVVNLDPIKYGLYFERFISKIRAKKQVVDGITYLDGSLMPDVDMDICYYRRPEVLEYLKNEFKGKTAKILTFNTLSAKLLIKEVGKTLGLKTEEEMNNVTSMVPKVHGVVQEIEMTYDTVEEFKNWCDANRQVYDTALKIKDLIKNKGAHPSGVIISCDDLEDSCPTEFSSDKELVSSYDMSWVSLFTIKMDVLGLRGVSVVDDICKDLKIEMKDIDIHDVKIYQNLQDLVNPHGLFQIEADLGFRTTQKVKPKNLSELSAVLALARPGAMQFIDDFAKFTNTQTYNSANPFYDDILKETGGVVLYQEQLMKMAHKIGFTLDEAEVLRRIIGKKKVEEMAKWQAKVYEKCTEHNLKKDVGDFLWSVMDASKDYSFNKSHSVAYAALSAMTVYLKFKYPIQFYLSLLKMTKFEPDSIGEITKIQKEMAAFNIKLLPPSLKHSKNSFSIEKNDIRFGLSSVKGIAEKAIEKLNNFKREHSNKFQLFQSAKESGLNIGIVSALIQSGALEGYGDNRSLLVYEAQLWNKLNETEKKAALVIAEKHDYRLAMVVSELCIIKNDKGHPIIKDKRLATIKKNTEKYKAIFNQNNICRDFANWWYERKLLGYNATLRIGDIFRHKYPSLMPINSVQSLSGKSKCAFIGIVEENAKYGISKAKGSRYAKYMVSDEFGTSKVMIFNDALDDCKNLNTRMPKEEDIVIVKGTKQGDDAVFAEMISIQQNQVYTKLIELKDTSKEETIISNSF